MPDASDLKNMLEDVVGACENRIESLSSLLETTHLVLREFQEPFLDNLDKAEESKDVNGQLQDLLARNEHLRKKDFNKMTQGIVVAQRQRRKEVANLLDEYLGEEKKVVEGFRGSLTTLKDSLRKCEAERLKESRELMADILTKQNERKEAVVTRLKEFQEEQVNLAGGLRELLARGTKLRIKDFKLTLEQFGLQHQQRSAGRAARKLEVRSMLGAFRKERLRTHQKERWDSAHKFAQRITFPVVTRHGGGAPSAGKQEKAEVPTRV